MNNDDVQEYGWDNDFDPVSVVHPDNTVQICGLKWGNNPGGIIGYFRFRCNSGRVSVYLETEAGFAFSWNEEFTYSEEPIIVGTWTFPQLAESVEPQPVLVYGPSNAGEPTQEQTDDRPVWP